MEKENIIDIVKQLTASGRVQFIKLLNEYTLADKIGTNTYGHPYLELDKINFSPNGFININQNGN